MATKKKVDALLQRAMDLRPKEVVRLGFEPLAAKAACRDGLTRLKPFRAELKKRYAGFDLDELDALPELCDRVIAAQRTVQQATKQSAADAITQAQSWRRRLVPIAQALAETGDIDARAFAKILTGSGLSDQLQDVVDLAALLGPVKSKAEALAGAGGLETAAAAAREALGAVGVGKAAPEAAVEASALRDRYATLVSRGHDRLRAAMAAVSNYAEAGVKVPNLNSGGRPRKSPSPAEKGPAEGPTD